jgi:hypothetical protein
MPSYQSGDWLPYDQLVGFIAGAGGQIKPGQLEMALIPLDEDVPYGKSGLTRKRRRFFLVFREAAEKVRGG